MLALSPLELYEDNQGAIASQKEVNPKERKRLRAGARGWRNSFEHFLLQRETTTGIHYVRAHTGKQDTISHGNDAADKVAKWASKNSSLPLLAAPKEERFIILVGNSVVKNDFIRTLKELCFCLSLKAWKDLRTGTDCP